MGAIMDSIEQLIGYYNRSDDGDMYHNVVENILLNLHKVENATIYDLAEMCFSSPSTISRLMKKMGFESYTDFKTKVHHALKNFRYLNRNTKDIDVMEDSDIVSLYFNFLENNIAALRQSIEYSQIAAISDCFNDAEEVFFYSFPEVQVNILQKLLIVSGKSARIFDTIQAKEGSLAKVKQNTVVYAMVPNLIEMAPMRSILKRAREQGATVITICSEKWNDYTKYSDIQISFNGTKTSMDLYLFMIMTNLVKYDYCHRYVDHLIEKLYD